MKVIFLNIDGVLQSVRSFIVNKKFALPTNLNLKGSFDPVAVNLLIDFCDKTSVDLILHSTWRSNAESINRLKDIGLPIKGTTDILASKADSIKRWIEENNPEKWCVLDDTRIDVDRLIYIDNLEGLLVKHLMEAEKLLDVRWQLPILMI